MKKWVGGATQHGHVRHALVEGEARSACGVDIYYVDHLPFILKTRPRRRDHCQACFRNMKD